jgi:chitosanase
MPNDRKRPIIDAIVATFETGDPYGGYDTVTVLNDGAGISYGKHQATDHADNLDRMCFRYVDRGGVFAAELEPYLPRLGRDETAQFGSDNYPEWVANLMDTLARAGREDPLMQRIQDEVFNEQYWLPAVRAAEDMQLVKPLTWALLYDTCIQSGDWLITSLRKKFPEVPPSRGGEEKAWSRAFAEARRDWLRSFVGKTDGHTRAVRGSAVRMDALIALMDEGNWRLKTPFNIGHPYNVVITDPSKNPIGV